MDTPWRVELLGDLRATQGNQLITRFRTRKNAALLAYPVNPAVVLTDVALQWARRAITADPLREETR